MTESVSNRVVVLGIGAFTQALMRVLREDGADVEGYLTRGYALHGPRTEGACVAAAERPNPCAAWAAKRPGLLVPMSLEWALQPWTAEFLKLGLPLLCPVGEGLRLERERDFARALCERFGIPFPRAHTVRTRADAESLVRSTSRAYVLKNPLCAPTSPIHTIVCESPEDTLAWLPRLDDSEGIFLQEYLGRREAGHIALVSDGRIYPLVTNQEYKRAFDGNLGIVAGAPLGGLVAQDPDDRYGLASQLLEPLTPWFRETRFHGPVQVTAIRHEDRWHVLEYNVRLGVTSGPLIARMLENPLDTFRRCAWNEALAPRWRAGHEYGCSLTLAGYGYPFVQTRGPRVPVTLSAPPDCDLWWQEVDDAGGGRLEATGHRICDVSATASTLPEAIAKAYAGIRRVRSLGSYFRTDVGESLWPPGAE